MIVAATNNGSVGIREAMQVLKSGGTVIDAVEAGIRLVEADAGIHDVGYSGLPNILGDVELDASIMEGGELKAGAVGCIRHYPHPISIARRVMAALPHVFLVGEGAERFAAEMGFEKAELLSEAARTQWDEHLAANLPAAALDDLGTQPDLSRWVRLAARTPEKPKGTTNFIARDDRGNICTGVSTSGWFAKYPGRIGDSPLIGAGNYADNRYGAAACTGMGEMAIRAGTARSVVLYMKMGLAVQEAGRQAMEDLNDLGGDYLDNMNIIVLDRDGSPAGFTNTEGKTFIYMTDEMDDPLTVERVYVETKRRWAAS